MYSSNALTWNSLPGLKRDSTAVSRKYNPGEVSFEKTPSGTYATEYYAIPREIEKQYLVISKLDKNKWKKVKAVTVKCVNHAYLYSIGLSNKIPSMIYNSGKTTAGYNLKTGKSYKLPFKFNYNMLMGGDTLVYSYGSKLYATKNTYKNMTRITLKSGKKKVSKEITRTGIQTVSKNTYVYFICGTKMYCTTINKLLSVK